MDHAKHIFPRQMFTCLFTVPLTWPVSVASSRAQLEKGSRWYWRYRYTRNNYFRSLLLTLCVCVCESVPVSVPFTEKVSSSVRQHNWRTVLMGGYANNRLLPLRTHTLLTVLIIPCMSWRSARIIKPTLYNRTYRRSYILRLIIQLRRFYSCLNYMVDFLTFSYSKTNKRREFIWFKTLELEFSPET